MSSTIPISLSHLNNDGSDLDLRDDYDHRFCDRAQKRNPSVVSKGRIVSADLIFSWPRTHPFATPLEPTPRIYCPLFPISPSHMLILTMRIGCDSTGIQNFISSNSRRHPKLCGIIHSTQRKSNDRRHHQRTTHAPKREEDEWKVGEVEGWAWTGSGSGRRG